jgi:two-component system chemotaxis response regulator CheY
MPSALIIDDSKIMRAQLRALLTTAGFTIAAEAGGADHLLALYEEHRPDLVTLDIVMPGRDGAEAAAELLAAHPEAAVVMCTSMGTREKMHACQQAGVRSYLLKPFKPEHAIAVFKRAIEHHGAPPAHPPAPTAGQDGSAA